VNVMNSTIRKLTSKLSAVLLHPAYHTIGDCNICGGRTLFVCDVVEDRWIRRCCRCRSTPKYRAIASVIESETGEKLTRFVGHCKVYELSTTSPIFRKLRGNPNYEASGYFSDLPFGEKTTPFYWNQDVQCLTFSSESFNVVISSETMEHVRRPWQGFSEIHRVLKPGGFFVFTVPYRSDRLTRPRVDTTGAEDVFLLPRIHHQDPYRPQDSLVYTDFGADLPDLLQPVGFDTKLVPVLNMPCDIHDDLRPVNVFVARKPSSPRLLQRHDSYSINSSGFPVVCTPRAI
jgi:SAM-dependent methyltransferase